MSTRQGRMLKLILFLALVVTVLTGCMAGSSPTVPAPAVTSPPQSTAPPLPPAATLGQSTPPLPQPATTPEPAAPPLPQTATPTATLEPAAPPLPQPAIPEPTTAPDRPGVTPGTAAEHEAPGGGYDFISVAAGGDHTCGLRSSGMALCWGDDPHGEGFTAAPEDVFQGLSAGAGYTCGIKTDGRVSCWGTWGISWGNTVGCCDSYEKPEPPDAIYKSISAGVAHACGIKVDDTLSCWGENRRSIGDFTEHIGQATAPAGTFQSVSTGVYHSCGVTTDGRVVCWGYGYDGQVAPLPGSFQSVSTGGGGRSCGLKTDGTVVCWEANYQGITTPAAGLFASLSAGGNYSCGVKITGELECWGHFYGGAASSFAPQGKFRSVSVDFSHSCAVRSDGAVVCWGRNLYRRLLGLQAQIACGVLPNGATVCPGDEGYNLLTAIHSDWIYPYDHNGSSYPCGKGLEGEIVCWDPYTEALVSPTPREVVAFDTADDSACWLLPDATVGCAGRFGSPSPAGAFQSVAVGEAAGSPDFACGVRSSGELACWGGCNGHDCGNIFPPEGVFKSVSLGYAHGCAIKIDDTVVCWGSVEPVGRGIPSPGTFRSLGGGDSVGHCGIRPDDTLDCWGEIQALPGAFQSFSMGIGSRGDFYCGVRTDGTIACANYGHYRELTPPEGQFQSVSVGAWHACGVRASSAVACWGWNTDYLGEVIGRATPPAGEFRAVSAGENYTCGIRSDGTLACWGWVPEVLQNLSGITP